MAGGQAEATHVESHRYRQGWEGISACPSPGPPVAPPRIIVIALVSSPRVSQGDTTRWPEREQQSATIRKQRLRAHRYPSGRRFVVRADNSSVRRGQGLSTESA